MYLISVAPMRSIINFEVTVLLTYWIMYVDRTTLDFKTVVYLLQRDRNFVSRQELERLMNFQRCHYSKALLYVMQFKHAVAGCECLDAMREYNKNKEL